uniref:Beta-glucosidase 18-like isoform X1 n=1 Tax=Rhizophora mucronata TaxID=61149 RepID=A0A2P2KYB5_RHIMU
MNIYYRLKAHILKMVKGSMFGMCLAIFQVTTLQFSFWFIYVFVFFLFFFVVHSLLIFGISECEISNQLGNWTQNQSSKREDGIPARLREISTKCEL